MGRGMRGEEGGQEESGSPDATMSLPSNGVTTGVPEVLAVEGRCMGV